MWETPISNTTRYNGTTNHSPAIKPPGMSHDLAHLVGASGQVCDGGGQAALGGQQGGVLAHHLLQEDAVSRRSAPAAAATLGLLRRPPQDHHLLHQLLEGERERRVPSLTTSVLS